MQKIAIRYDNMLADHLAAERLYYSGTKLAKMDKVVAVLLFGFGVYMVSTVGVQWWTAIWLVLAPLEWFNLLSIRPLQVRFAYRSNPKFHETYEMEFSDLGIRFKTASIDSDIAWTHYSRVLENDRIFLLVYGKRMYSVIPKRAFGGAAEIAAFREMLRRNITDRLAS